MTWEKGKQPEHITRKGGGKIGDVIRMKRKEGAKKLLAEIDEWLEQYDKRQEEEALIEDDARREESDRELLNFRKRLFEAIKRLEQDDTRQEKVFIDKLAHAE